MHAPNRREFLAGAAAAGAALAAPRSLFGFAEKPADMAIARWSGSMDLAAAEMQEAAAQLTEKAIESIGGMKRFVTRGSVVWVKPNIGWDRPPELAANTNPDVVATVVRHCLDAGAKVVKVGDNPCDLPARTYKVSGIADAAKRAGAEVVFLDRSRFRTKRIGGERVKELPMCPDILECDLIVNVPIVKHHGRSEATLCMKNFMGVIEQRKTFHQAIPECLVDLNRYLKPQISILDGIRILTAHGPKGGDPKDVAVKMQVAAGIDVVAMDAWGAELLGRKPEEIGSVTLGDKMELGNMDYRSLNLKEVAV